MEIRDAVIASLHNYDLISFLPQARFRFYLLRISSFCCPSIMIVNLNYNLFNRRTQILFVTVAEAVPFVLFYKRRRKASKQERRTPEIHILQFIFNESIFYTTKETL